MPGRYHPEGTTVGRGLSHDRGSHPASHILLAPRHAGRGMRAVQELVGHQDLTMTQRYIAPESGAADRTVRLLERGRRVRPDGEILETAKPGRRRRTGRTR